MGWVGVWSNFDHDDCDKGDCCGNAGESDVKSAKLDLGGRLYCVLCFGDIGLERLLYRCAFQSENAAFGRGACSGNTRKTVVNRAKPDFGGRLYCVSASCFLSDVTRMCC